MTSDDTCHPVAGEEVCPFLYGPVGVAVEGRIDGSPWQVIWYLDALNGLCVGYRASNDLYDVANCHPWGPAEPLIRLGSGILPLGRRASHRLVFGPVTPLAASVELDFGAGRKLTLYPLRMNDSLSVFVYGPIPIGQPYPIAATALRPDGTVLGRDKPDACSEYRGC